jgi:hypothetical protein
MNVGYVMDMAGQASELALWTLTPVELASAISRLVRDGAMSEKQASQAENSAPRGSGRAAVLAVECFIHSTVGSPWLPGVRDSAS